MVDFVRSCYQSEWQFFVDNPELTTTGRFYFAEPETPHLPGFHYFGSRNWHDTNWPKKITLGERIDVRQAWSPGTPPALVPLARIVGSFRCIREGERAENAVDPSTLVDGFPTQCYVPPGENNPLWFLVSSYNRPELLRFYAQIIAWSYDDNDIAIREAFTTWLGPDVVVTFHPAVGLMPAVTTVVHPEFSIAVFDGSRDYQQIALQGFQLLQGPTNRGGFSTLPLWYDAGTYANGLLTEDGANPIAPIMLVGHSYGGAVALDLATRYRRWNPDRQIRYITYGAPRNGDVRQERTLRTTQGIALTNDDDIVTALPPTIETLAPVMAIVPNPALRNYLGWQNTPNNTSINQQGQFTPNGYALLDTSTLLAFVLRAINGQVQPIIPAHAIEEYIRRIAISAPAPGWPIPASVWSLYNSTSAPILLGGTGGQGYPTPGESGARLGGTGGTGVYIVGTGGMLLGGTGGDGVAPAGDGGLLLGGTGGDGAAPAGDGGLLLGGTG